MSMSRDRYDIVIRMEKNIVAIVAPLTVKNFCIRNSRTRHLFLHHEEERNVIVEQILPFNRYRELRIEQEVVPGASWTPNSRATILTALVLVFIQRKRFSRYEPIPTPLSSISAVVVSLLETGIDRIFLKLLFTIRYFRSLDCDKKGAMCTRSYGIEIWHVGNIYFNSEKYSTNRFLREYNYPTEDKILYLKCVK